MSAKQVQEVQLEDTPSHEKYSEILTVLSPTFPLWHRWFSPVTQFYLPPPNSL